MQHRNETTESEPIAGAALDAQRFGRFVPIERIGAGAMGVVYAAYDPELDRRVALKVLRGAANRDARRRRVRREALAMARVNHPNVISIYEVGEADGRVFIAMEYADGSTLTEWIAREPHDWSVVLELFARIGRGLAAAHEQGLVHRDFKPDNVLVDGRGHPFVIDFGLARIADEEGGDECEGQGDGRTESARPADAPDPLAEVNQLTREGRLRGTPAYMAPELLDGRPHDDVSDQYAFCVTLFGAVYGQPPHPRGSLAALRSAMVRGVIDVPARSDVPLPVLRILQRGLDPDPAARWPSMAALVDALETVDQAAIERSRGMRMRMLMLVASMVFVVALTLRAAIQGPPADVGTAVVISSVITAIMVVLLAAALRRSPSNRLTIGLLQVVAALAVTKTAALLMGALTGANVDQAFAVDAVIFTGFFMLGSVLLDLDFGPARWAMLLSVAAMVIAPAQIFALHSLMLGLALVGIINAEWRIQQRLRRA